jgi:hypothetical protein
MKMMDISQLVESGRIHELAAQCSVPSFVAHLQDARDIPNTYEHEKDKSMGSRKKHHE